MAAIPVAEMVVVDTIEELSNLLSHNQDTVHAENRCVEMCNFCMVDLLFLTGHGIKAGTHANAKTHISQLGASSEPGKHLACGLMLPRP